MFTGPAIDLIAIFSKSSAGRCRRRQPHSSCLRNSFGENAQVDHLGNFSWKNVNPGNYVVRLYGGNGQDSSFLKSARVGANNIDSSFALTGPAVLDLVVSTKGAIIEGAVTEHDQLGNDAPVSNVQVVAVPEEKYRKIPERFGDGATDQFGRFTIRGLAPGTYTLFAWQDVSDDVYRDPDFLKSQEMNGTTVKVEEGRSSKRQPEAECRSATIGVKNRQPSRRRLSSPLLRIPLQCLLWLFV